MFASHFGPIRLVVSLVRAEHSVVALLAFWPLLRPHNESVHPRNRCSRLWCRYFFGPSCVRTDVVCVWWAVIFQDREFKASPALTAMLPSAASVVPAKSVPSTMPAMPSAVADALMADGAVPSIYWENLWGAIPHPVKVRGVACCLFRDLQTTLRCGTACNVSLVLRALRNR